MSKSSFFIGQPIFGQVLKFIPRSLVTAVARQHKADRYCKRFGSYDHLVTILYAILNRCTSLREVSTGMLAWEQRLVHLGLAHPPRRSTISDANNRRHAEVFEHIYCKLFERYGHFLSDSRRNNLKSRLYILDSSTITLFQEVLKGTGLPTASGKRKGGIKVHTLIRSDQDIPCMIRFSAATTNDTRFLKEVHLPKGSIIVFDKGYNDYTTLNRFEQQGISWVTRLRQRLKYKVVADRIIASDQHQSGVISDQEIMLGNDCKPNQTKVRARLITFKDQQTGRLFEFVTNNFRMHPDTIARLYKQRWQIELLFKRIKQNYPLKYFLGDSENAIKIQIWCALIVDMILKLIQKKCKARWSFANLAAMIRLHLMTYIDLLKFLQCPEKSLLKNMSEKSTNQLLLIT